MIKPIGEHQTFESMIGYCVKDAGKSTFHYYQKDVPPGDIRAAIRSYNAVKIDYANGRTQLFKNNYLVQLYRFWHRNLRPLQLEFEVLVLYAIHSKQYVFAQTWCATASGVPLRKRMVEASTVSREGSASGCPLPVVGSL
jgi:hypothetical protein